MKGWSRAALGEITRVVGGTTPPTADATNYAGDVVWVTPVDLGRLRQPTIAASGRQITTAARLRAGMELLPAGTVVMSSRAPIGHLGISALPLCTNQGCKSFVPGPGIDSWFLYYSLRSRIAEIRALGSGATFAEVSKSSLERYEISFPSIQEQRRIAAEVTVQLAAAEAAGTAAEGRRALSDDLRVQVMRESIPLPSGGPWPWVELDAVAEFLDSKRRPVSATDRASRIKGLQVNELVPYYGANGQAGWIDDHLFDEPLVLLAEDGGAFGSTRTPIAYRIDGRAWVNNHAHVLRPRQGVDVDFLGFALSIRPDIGRVVSGSTRGKLNRSVAGAIYVPMPPPEVQTRVASRLRGLLGRIDTLQAFARSEREAIGDLPSSLLRRSFEEVAA